MKNGTRTNSKCLIQTFVLFPCSTIKYSLLCKLYVISETVNKQKDDQTANLLVIER